MEVEMWKTLYLISYVLHAKLSAFTTYLEVKIYKDSRRFWSQRDLNPLPEGLHGLQEGLQDNWVLGCWEMDLQSWCLCFERKVWGAQSYQGYENSCQDVRGERRTVRTFSLTQMFNNIWLQWMLGKTALWPICLRGRSRWYHLRTGSTRLLAGSLTSGILGRRYWILLALVMPNKSVKRSTH